MEKVLPKGWEVVKSYLISDITDYVANGSFQSLSENVKTYDNEEYAILLRLKDFNNDFKHNLKYVDEKSYKFLAKSEIKEGDLFISNVGNPGICHLVPNLGRPVTLGPNGIRLRVSTYGDISFIKYYLESPQGKNEINEITTGTAQLKFNKTDFRNLLFPLPPLPEQKRIALKLDKLFAQHEKIKKALDRIPQLLKIFRQRVLTHAVTGKLTKQWLKGRSLDVKFGLTNTGFRPWKFSTPSRWKVVAFGDVAEVKSNLVDPNNFSDYFLIAPDNIEANTGKLINTPLVSEVNPKSGKHLFNKGVIIYSKIRPYLNKLIIADFYGLCSADMYPIDNTVHTEIKYLYYYMLSNEFLSYSTTAGERSVLPKINQKGLNEIPFPLPALEEQQEIVRRVESLFAKADAIEVRYQTLKAKVDTLPQTILHKAFKGELVPQLPTDGDAKDLLAEIMALKKDAKKKGKA